MHLQFQAAIAFALSNFALALASNLLLLLPPLLLPPLPPPLLLHPRPIFFSRVSVCHNHCCIYLLLLPLPLPSLLMLLSPLPSLSNYSTRLCGIITVR